MKTRKAERRKIDMNDRDQWTCDAMRKYGGSFVKLLGELAEHADSDNLNRIKETWPEYWTEYEKTGIKMEKGDILDF